MSLLKSMMSMARLISTVLRACAVGQAI
jgi:hypothetical protein